MESSSKRIIFTISILGYWACLFLGATTSARELLRESSCGDELLNLECGPRSVIAIHEAFFTRDMEEVANMTCDPHIPDPNITFNSYPEDEDYVFRNSSIHCYEDLRISVNRRCSGLNRCNYSHFEEKERLCESAGGAVIVQYDCVRDINLHKFCNTRLHFKEGYIASPAYPSFYPELKDCNWTIEAADGQIVVLQLLHVQMRPARITHYEEPDPLGMFAVLRPITYHCDDDVLRILENGHKKALLCGENLESLKSIELDVSKGAVIQFSSREFFPGSGFLLRYRIKGCPTLSPPSDGYMIYRNGSEALYFCNKGRVFNDTLEPSRTLQCIGEHRWNDTTLSPCFVAEDVIKQQQQVYLNHTLDELKSVEPENMTSDEAPKPAVLLTESFIGDILVPSVLMGILLIGNIIIITVIFVIRRKQKKKPDEFDDITNNQKSQPLMQEGTDV